MQEKAGPPGDSREPGFECGLCEGVDAEAGAGFASLLGCGLGGFVVVVLVRCLGRSLLGPYRLLLGLSCLNAC